MAVGTSILIPRPDNADSYDYVLVVTVDAADEAALEAAIEAVRNPV